MKREETINILIKHFNALGIHTNSQGYVLNNEDNLITQFNNWGVIQNEIGNGNGSELKPDSNGVIKFNASYSSSALCVNNFAPFKEMKDKFSLFNYSGFTEATFEKKLPTNISIPNLDFYLESAYEVIGIESKFIEVLDCKLPNNNLSKYIAKRQQLSYLPDNFFKIMEYYICKDFKMNLDVAQLIKHSIGLIKRSISKYKFVLNSMLVKPILVYIYWQPVNWYKFDLYQKHEDEINEFKSIINDYLIFIPISYLEFWKCYENDNLFGNHIKKVKSRYYISL